MSLHFEAYVECKTTRELVATGYVMERDYFQADEKPFGIFQCRACLNVHVWEFNEARVRLVIE